MSNSTTQLVDTFIVPGEGTFQSRSHGDDRPRRGVRGVALVALASLFAAACATQVDPPPDPGPPPAQTPTVTPTARAALPALAFVLTQGWGSDLGSQAETPWGEVMLRGAIANLQHYRTKYDAYAIVSTNIADKAGKLTHVLDELAAAGVPFILDVMSSDMWELRNETLYQDGPKVNQAASVWAGLGVWPTLGGNPADPYQLEYYRNRYPTMFRGIRIMEPGDMYKMYEASGWSFADLNATITNIVQYAAHYGLFVEYNTLTWDCHADTDTWKCPDSYVKGTLQYLIANLMVQYPGVVYPTWPTNDGTNVERLDPGNKDGWASWESLVQPYWGERGMGISDQFWMTGAQAPDGSWYTVDDLPAQYVIAMVRDALDHGASLIQFEPYSRMFDPSTGGPSPANCLIGLELGVNFCNVKDRLETGQSLVAENGIPSQSGNVSLWVKNDGNMVVYGPNPLWSTGTWTVGAGSTAVMQSDGNFVLYNPNSPNGVSWASNTYTHHGAYLRVQDDGNVVVYDRDRRPLWSWMTGRLQ